MYFFNSVRCEKSKWSPLRYIIFRWYKSTPSGPDKTVAALVNICSVLINVQANMAAGAR